MDEVEIRWTPGLKTPAQDGFVEAAAALDVICVNGKTGKIVGHVQRIIEPGPESQSRYSDI